MFAQFKIYIYAAIAIAIGLFCWWAHSAIKESGREEIRAAWAVDTIKRAEESRKLVDEVKRSAAEDEKRKEDARKQREQEERELQQKALAELHKLNSDLERRYLKAVLEDASCAAWTKETVKCPML